MTSPEIAAKWSHWKDIDRCELWRAVLLTLDIDPRCFRVSSQTGDLSPVDRYHGFVTPEHNQLISERLQVARSHLGGRLQALEPHRFEHRCSISLPNFGSWAPVDWNLPAEFPRVDGNGSHGRSGPDVLPRPDWAIWSQRLEAVITHATALSCDIDPEKIRGNSDQLKEYFRRGQIAQDHVNAGRLQVFPRRWGLNPAVNHVRLVDYARMAIELGWTLPQEFPRASEHPIAAGSKAAWPWGSYETPHLKALADAGKAFFGKPHARGDEPKSQSVSDWLEERGVPHTMAVMMARIFRDPATPAGPRREPRKKEK